MEKSHNIIAPHESLAHTDERPVTTSFPIDVVGRDVCMTEYSAEVVNEYASRSHKRKCGENCNIQSLSYRRKPIQVARLNIVGRPKTGSST